MKYDYLNNSIDKENIILPNSDKINPFLQKNNSAEIIKAIDFLASDEKFLYVHGFMGTGKRQFINYVCEFLNKDVIKLEYYCKEATVCDDILLNFTDVIDKNSISKAVNLNAKITTMAVKLKQQIGSIKKPFLIILHSLDDILQENIDIVAETFSTLLKEENVKIIVSTRAMKPSVLADAQEDRKIFLKAFTQDIFKEFIVSNGVKASDKNIEDFYKITRGYYYYIALSIKIIQAMNLELAEFIQKFNQSEMTFDSYLGATYVNLIPSSIRNFFWFLRTIRHGLTLNALALFELYDEFSINYLKTNLMLFQVDETLYVQDYFIKNIEMMIPEKTEIRLHKYIIGIYEKQLKEPLKSRAVLISRQALRAEIEYHNKKITELESGEKKLVDENVIEETIAEQKGKQDNAEVTYFELISQAQSLEQDKKYTEAIELISKVIEADQIDLPTLVEARSILGKIYKQIDNLSMAAHYLELVETYYKEHQEFINLNYLYYDLTEVYFKMYKNDRAIETIKKVIYSVDTPQSLMVSACTLLGNIYSNMNNSNDAYTYYKKALESLDDNAESSILSELFFKYALSCDDQGNFEEAYEYYNRCIAIGGENPNKSLAYSNLASCYYENNNIEDAKNCFLKAYEIDKNTNNYDGIYYNTSKLAGIYLEENSPKSKEYLLEAKQSAEFLHEPYYIVESSIALGDYYYNDKSKYKESLKEYFNAKKLVMTYNLSIDISIIEQRIADMKLRMPENDYEEIERKYNE